MPSPKSPVSSRSKSAETHPDTRLIPDDDHPDYIGGTIEEGTAFADMPAPEGPPLAPFPLKPQPLPRPIPWPLPINICAAVSGRYTYIPATRPRPNPPTKIPILPLNLLSITVRVDVDRFFPQNRISIEVSRLIPRVNAHVIAEVTSDQCLGINRRRIAATITYREGNAALIPGDQVLFEATRGRGFNYGHYTLTLSGAGTTPRSYDLAFQSKYFDPVEFEVDRVANAGNAVTTYDTGTHTNRPADLPSETISLATVYQRAGFDVTMSPNTTVIPNADAGANGTWSDGEMHNAMVTYWSRFADRPQWAMWVLYAAQHDQGRSLGGVMFDDIGPNHRQGTAIFTDSFIQDVTPGDANPAAWRERMVFWTAVHEMGHAFNLAHAWQKALGVPQGAPGDPWIPLSNQPESRSFMNYPFRVAGGETSFFSDFRFRFTDDELLFMRHAPRRFVQMGNSNWFINHGFEAPSALMRTGRWALKIRPNREANDYSFLEPVVMELKLTNTSARAASFDMNLLADGRHVTIFVQREGGETQQWRPLITRCHEEHDGALKQGESIYGAHTISASSAGWLIDEPGFYKTQAAVDMGDEIVVSNVLRLFVAPPVLTEESKLALDYFTEDVGRVLAFGGAPALASAVATLESVAERCPKNPAALHAAVALSTPKLRKYKELEVGVDRASFAIRSKSADVNTAAKVQMAVLMDSPEKAADTLGHIDCFRAFDKLAVAMADAGNEKGAKKVMQSSVATMKKRAILGSVVQAAERNLARMK
jgi:hypothetical protein